MTKFPFYYQFAKGLRKFAKMTDYFRSLHDQKDFLQSPVL